MVTGDGGDKRGAGDESVRKDISRRFGSSKLSYLIFFFVFVFFFSFFFCVLFSFTTSTHISTLIRLFLSLPLVRIRQNTLLFLFHTFRFILTPVLISTRENATRFNELFFFLFSSATPLLASLAYAFNPYIRMYIYFFFSWFPISLYVHVACKNHNYQSDNRAESSFLFPSCSFNSLNFDYFSRSRSFFFCFRLPIINYHYYYYYYSF